MFISIEQPYTTQLDQVVSGISRAIRELTAAQPPSRGHYGGLLTSFVHFVRCVTVRALEIRTPSVAYEVVLLVLAMNKAIKTLLLDPAAIAAQLKIVVENLKNVMVLIKSNMPSKVGKELLPAEESTLYKEAIDLLTQTVEGMNSRPSKEMPFREVEPHVKSALTQLPKLQSGFREIHGLTNQKEKMKGGLGALGRGVLGDAQQLAAATVAAARLCAAKLSELQPNQLAEEWKDGRLAATETMVMGGWMVELVVACIAIRNRLAHHSHVPIVLVLFSISAQLALFPYF